MEREGEREGKGEEGREGGGGGARERDFQPSWQRHRTGCRRSPVRTLPLPPGAFACWRRPCGVAWDAVPEQTWFLIATGNTRLLEGGGDPAHCSGLLAVELRLDEAGGAVRHD